MYTDKTSTEGEIADTIHETRHVDDDLYDEINDEINVLACTTKPEVFHSGMFNSQQPS